jgi:ADP-ribose pyrophosphatase YjhB (NUDIX family)
MNFIQQLLYNFKPYYATEYQIKKNIIAFLSGFPDCLYRYNQSGHLTVSAMIVNQAKTKVLLCYHTRYNEWSPVGGHSDGNPDLKVVIENEIYEELGITNNMLEINLTNGLISIDQSTYHCRTETTIHYDMCFIVTLKKDTVDVKLNDEIKQIKWFDLSKTITDQNNEHEKIPAYMIQYYQSLQLYINRNNNLTR